MQQIATNLAQALAVAQQSSCVNNPPTPPTVDENCIRVYQRECYQGASQEFCIHEGSSSNYRTLWNFAGDYSLYSTQQSAGRKSWVDNTVKKTDDSVKAAGCVKQFQSYVVGSKVTASVCAKARGSALIDDTFMDEFNACENDVHFHSLDDLTGPHDFTLGESRVKPNADYFWLKVEERQPQEVAWAYDQAGCVGNETPISVDPSFMLSGLQDAGTATVPPVTIKSLRVVDNSWAAVYARTAPPDSDPRPVVIWSPDDNSTCLDIEAKDYQYVLAGAYKKTELCGNSEIIPNHVYCTPADPPLFTEFGKAWMQSLCKLMPTAPQCQLS